MNAKMFPAAATLLGIDPAELESALKQKQEVPEIENRDVLTIRDIAFRGSVSERQAARWIADGKLKSIRFGRRCVRVPVTEWRKFLKLK